MTDTQPTQPTQTYFQKWYSVPENKEKRKQKYEANKDRLREAYLKKRYDDAGKLRPVKKAVKTAADIKHDEIVALYNRLKQLVPGLDGGLGQN